jgi:hypothetical protein
VDSPKVVASAKRVLVLAGYDQALLGPDDEDSSLKLINLVKPTELP